MKTQISTTVPAATRQQVNQLIKEHGYSMREVLILAVGDFHAKSFGATEQPIEQPVEIVGVETRPELDPYHRDTGGETGTQLWIDPEKRRCGVCQVYDSGGTPVDEWHNRILTGGFEFRPNEDALEEYLRSAPGQALLARACDGHAVEWDGRNLVGSLTEDADQAYQQLFVDAEDLPECAWALWQVGDWIPDPGDVGVDADTTDEDIARISAELTQRSIDEHVIIDDDIADYLAEYRDEQGNN